MIARFAMLSILLTSQVAAGACRTPQVATVQLASGLTVVPFAVPVAVPVAVIQQPAVLYGYTPSCVAATSQAPQDTAVAATSLDAPSILARHCGECHGQRQSGGLRLFSDDGSLLSRLPRQRVLEALLGDGVAAPSMPPTNRPRLSDDELRVIREWAKPPLELEY